MKKYTLSTALLSTVVLSAMVVESPLIANAATKISTVTSTNSKISESGKLISKKTGKSLKGYKRYNNKMYFNGALFSGIVNKNYYKNGSKATAVYKKQYFKKGTLSTGLYKKVYYVKGKAANGLYKKVYYVKGKAANGLHKNNYYVKGKAASGLYKNNYYVKGKAATAVYKNLYYVKGKLFTGKANNVQYIKGVNKGAYEVEDKLIIRDFFVIDIENKLPEYVEIQKSDATSMESLVTWQVQPENKDVLEIKGNTIRGTKSGNYYLVGIIPNSTFKPTLKIFVGSYNDIYQEITIDLFLKDEVRRILEKSKSEKVMQTSFNTEFNQVNFEGLTGASEATNMLNYAGFTNRFGSNNSNTTPDNSNTTPDNSNTTPGDSTTPPGDSNTTPGNSTTPPISSNEYELFATNMSLRHAGADVRTILSEINNSRATLFNSIAFRSVLVPANPNLQFLLPPSFSQGSRASRLDSSLQEMQRIMSELNRNNPNANVISRPSNLTALELGRAAIVEIRNLEPITPPVTQPIEPEENPDLEEVTEDPSVLPEQ